MNEKLIALKRTLIMVVLATVAPLLIAFLLTLDSEHYIRCIVCLWCLYNLCN